MPFSRKTIEALAMAITGGSHNDPDPPVPKYRAGWEIEDFFREHGWSGRIGSDSRFPFTKRFLFTIHEGPNGNEELAKLFEAAVDPRDFVEQPGDLPVVVDYLNTYLRFDGLELKREGPGFALVPFQGNPVAAVERGRLGEDYEYDVAFTFAGEDRDYVRSVAEIVEAEDIRYFYDEHYEVELWGKNLQEHFDYIFRTASRFCVMFISEHYAHKMWPCAERRSALAAAMERPEEYVLPTRFDDTELPGLVPSTGYVDLRELEPVELAERIIKKVRGSNSR